jgi:uncharacterized membrane protein
MSTIERTIEVAVPVRTAYDQWTQFEEFPRFMVNVTRVEQLGDAHVRWHIDVSGVDRSFDTAITEQHPDERIAWTTLPEAETRHAGLVTFRPLDADRSEVRLRIEFEPGDTLERIGAALGITERSVESDLENLKRFIEERQTESGAWRGAIDPTGGPSGARPPR